MVDRRGNQPIPVSLRWLNRRLIIVVSLVATIVSLIVGGATALVIQGQANASARHSAVNDCDGVNLLRGFARLAIHRFHPTFPNTASRADYLLRIRDCGKTYDQDRIVVLSPTGEYNYLKALAMGQRVRVRDGGHHLEPMP